MSRQHPRWLCPTLNMLVINNFANVYGKNKWDFHFRNPERTGGGASTILLYIVQYVAYGLGFQYEYVPLHPIQPTNN